MSHAENQTKPLWAFPGNLSFLSIFASPIDGFPSLLTPLILSLSVAMSQEYFPGQGASSAGEGSSSPSSSSPTHAYPPPPTEEERLPSTSSSTMFPRPPPAYMTVGNGSTSESATALMASLHEDSGYGGSIPSGSVMEGDAGGDWRADLMVDRPTPMHTPTHLGEWNPAGSFLSPD